MNSIVVFLLMIFALPQSVLAITSMYGSGVYGGSQACPYQVSRSESHLERSYNQQGALEHNIEIEEENIEELRESIEDFKATIDDMYKSDARADFVYNYSGNLNHGADACYYCSGFNHDGTCSSPSSSPSSRSYPSSSSNVSPAKDAGRFIASVNQPEETPASIMRSLGIDAFPAILSSNNTVIKTRAMSAVTVESVGGGRSLASVGSRSANSVNDTDEPPAQVGGDTLIFDEPEPTSDSSLEPPVATQPQPRPRPTPPIVPAVPKKPVVTQQPAPSVIVPAVPAPAPPTGRTVTSSTTHTRAPQETSPPPPDCENKGKDFCLYCNRELTPKDRKKFNPEVFCKSKYLTSTRSRNEANCISRLKRLRALQEELENSEYSLEEFLVEQEELESDIKTAERKRRRGETEGSYEPPCPTGNCGSNKTYDFIKNIGLPILAGYIGYRGVKKVSETNAALNYGTNTNAGLLGGMLALQGIYGAGSSGTGHGSYGCASGYSNGGRITGSILGAAALAGGVQFPGSQTGAFGYPQSYYQTPPGGGLFNAGILASGGAPGYNFGVSGSIGIGGSGFPGAGGPGFPGGAPGFPGAGGGGGYPMLGGSIFGGGGAIGGSFPGGYPPGAGSTGLNCFLPPCPSNGGYPGGISGGGVNLNGSFGAGYPGQGGAGGINSEYYYQQQQEYQAQLQYQLQIQQEQSAKYQQWSELNQQIGAIQQQQAQIFNSTGGYSLGVSGSASVGVSNGPSAPLTPVDSSGATPASRGQ